MATILLTEALADLNIDLNDVCVFGYLPTATDTTTTAADTYYPVAGPFTNPYLRGFTTGTDLIEYTGTNSKVIKILIMCSASSDTSTTTVTIGVKKNGVIVSGSETSRLLKLTSDIGAWSSMCDVEIASGDEIQLVAKSDKAGAVITFNNFQSNLFQTMITHE